MVWGATVTETGVGQTTVTHTPAASEAVRVDQLTSLSDKHFSPMTVRKYTSFWGIPIFVALITDDDISDLDTTVAGALGGTDRPRSLQDWRNLAGRLTEVLASRYARSEGIAVVIFPDKAAVASLWGDFMNHLHCRLELYALINTMWML